MARKKRQSKVATQAAALGELSAMCANKVLELYNSEVSVNFHDIFLNYDQSKFRKSLQKSEEFRVEGNRLFGAKQFHAALEFYNQVSLRQLHTNISIVYLISGAKIRSMGRSFRWE